MGIYGLTYLTSPLEGDVDWDDIRQPNHFCRDNPTSYYAYPGKYVAPGTWLCSGEWAICSGIWNLQFVQEFGHRKYFSEIVLINELLSSKRMLQCFGTLMIRT